MPFDQKGITERPLLTKPKGGFKKMKLTKEQLKEFTDGIVEDELTTQEYEEQREVAEHEEMLRLLGFKKRRKIEYNYEFDPLDFEGTSEPTTEEDVEKEKLRGIAEIFDTSDDCLVKTIEYDDTVEVITSYNQVNGKGFKKIQNLPGNQYKNLETGEIYSKQKHEKRSESPSTFRNSVKEIERLIRINFAGSSGYFITLAYECYILEADKVQKDYEKFYSRFLYRYGTKTNTKLLFIRVLEPSPEDVEDGWHIHFLVKAADGKNLNITKEQIIKIWGDNNVSVCPISKSNPYSDISVFYDTDGLMPFYDSGMNLFTCSQELTRPDVKTMTRKEMKAKVAGYNRTSDHITIFEKRKKMSSHPLNAVRHETYQK